MYRFSDEYACVISTPLQVLSIRYRIIFQQLICYLHFHKSFKHDIIQIKYASDGLPTKFQLPIEIIHLG